MKTSLNVNSNKLSCCGKLSYYLMMIGHETLMQSYHNQPHPSKNCTKLYLFIETKWFSLACIRGLLLCCTEILAALWMDCNEWGKTSEHKQFVMKMTRYLIAFSGISIQFQRQKRYNSTHFKDAATVSILKCKLFKLLIIVFEVDIPNQPDFKLIKSLMIAFR